nr:hypothetical protein GCM10025699_54580 [Microbacterium flavescens]
MTPLLRAVADAAGDTPVLVKIAPDLTDDGIRRIGELVGELGLAGVIATNTTLSRDGLATDPAVVAAAGAGESREPLSPPDRSRSCGSSASPSPRGPAWCPSAG